MFSQWNTAITEFMHNLGFGDFKIGETNTPSVNNIIIGEGRCVLDIEELDEDRGVIMALFRKVPAHELYDKTRLLLAAVHYDKFLPMVVRVGLRGSDTLVLMVHVEQAWAESLNRSLDLMYKIYADIDA